MLELDHLAMGTSAKLRNKIAVPVSHLSLTSSSFLAVRALSCIAMGEGNAGESAMRYLVLIATTVFGITAAITAAQAQTASDQTGSTGTTSDPLSVPTSSLPTGSSFSIGSAGASGGSATETTGSGVAGSNSASGFSASSSNTSQVPLQLSGETPNTSTQAATSTAAAASHSSSTICPPPVPTSDGGSANLTEMVGGSLSGC